MKISKPKGRIYDERLFWSIIMLLIGLAIIIYGSIQFFKNNTDEGIIGMFGGILVCGPSCLLFYAFYTHGREKFDSNWLKTEYMKAWEDTPLKEIEHWNFHSGHLTAIFNKELIEIGIHRVEIRTVQDLEDERLYYKYLEVEDHPQFSKERFILYIIANRALNI